MGSKILELDPKIVPRTLDPCWKVVAEAIRGVPGEHITCSRERFTTETGAEENKNLDVPSVGLPLSREKPQAGPVDTPKWALLIVGEACLNETRFACDG